MMRKAGLPLLLLLAGCSAMSKDYSAVALDLQAADENFFLLGNARIGAQNDLPGRIVSISEYGDMKCAAAAGYLRFTRDPDQPAIGGEIVTELTPQGASALKAFTEDEASRRYEATRVGLDLFKIRLTTSSIDRIVSDTEISKVSGSFRVVEYTTKRTKTPDGKRYYAACPEQGLLAGPGRARMLLRKDSFAGKWIPVVADTVPIDGEFLTDYVGQALKRL